MTYKLRVVSERNNVKWSELLCTNQIEDAEDLAIFLSEYNGSDLRGTDFIEFDTEEDAMIFKLKFNV
jgi:hypothetical protein